MDRAGRPGLPLARHSHHDAWAAGDCPRPARAGGQPRPQSARLPRARARRNRSIRARICRYHAAGPGRRRRTGDDQTRTLGGHAAAEVSLIVAMIGALSASWRDWWMIVECEFCATTLPNSYPVTGRI